MSGNARTSAASARCALQKQFDNTFGGQSAKQAKHVQRAALHAARQPQPDARHDHPSGLQAAAETARAARAGQDHRRDQQDVHAQGPRPLQKIHISEAAARRNLGPLVTAGPRRVPPLHVGDKMSTQFEHAVPRLADAAGHAAPRVAGAFVRGWLHAGTWGKLFTAGLLLRKMGAFSARAASPPARSSAATSRPSSPARPRPPQARGAGGAAGALGLLGRAGPLGLAFAGAAAGGGLLGHWLGERANDRDARHRHQANIRRFRARGEIPVTLPDGTTYWESRANARVDPNYHPRARARSPRARGAHIEHIHLHMDGREVTHVVRRVVRDEQARR
jgi:hypothetical protein